MKYLNLNISKRRKVSSIAYNNEVIWYNWDSITMIGSIFSSHQYSNTISINSTRSIFDLTNSFKSNLETILNKKPHISDIDKQLLLESKDTEEYLLNLTELLL